MLSSARPGGGENTSKRTSPVSLVSDESPLLCHISHLSERLSFEVWVEASSQSMGPITASISAIGWGKEMGLSDKYREFSDEECPLPHHVFFSPQRKSADSNLHLLQTRKEACLAPKVYRKLLARASIEPYALTVLCMRPCSDGSWACFGLISMQLTYVSASPPMLFVPSW